MHLILCHTTADFDTLGAAVGLTRLQKGSKIVLTGGCHPAVQEFLALHRDEYALIERRSVNPKEVRSLTVVDAQSRDRIGKAAEWLNLPGIEIAIYDHHLGAESDIPAGQRHIDAVGATSTLVAERLQAEGIQLNGVEATVMALGIHVDTGSLTFEQSTPRDAQALAWLMQQGASLRAIADYVEPGLSSTLQDLLADALEQLHTEVHQGYRLSWVMLQTDTYTPGLSSLASHLLDLTDSDTLLLGNHYPLHEDGENRMTIIGRSRSRPFGESPEGGVNLREILEALGGGGHATAAAVTLRGVDPETTLNKLVDQVRSRIPQPPAARELMSSPVRTIRPDTTIAEAQRILLRYGHSGLSVVDENDNLMGIISRRDLDIALHHGFSHAPVKGYMTTNVKTITPETLLPDIESLMVTYDIGRLPVLDQGNLVGIVTRTDVLRRLHQDKTLSARPEATEEDDLRYCPLPSSLRRRLRHCLVPQLWDVLMAAATEAERQGWHLYLVGGAVRDVLLAHPTDPPLLSDVDLVVDGYHRTAQAGAGVELAKALRQRYPQSRLQVHGRFQTAALIWHKDPELDSLMIDIATARTEFYPYPAANPEVEASSIRQDLYRRDFTINAMAIRLTSPAGELLDFFGGLIDLQTRQIRVLHTNSFIEDPTRIYRAVRFAVRLDFEIDDQTERYIRHAIESGIYRQIQTQLEKAPALQTRLKNELKYILQAPYWKPAIRLLADLGALQCIHSSLEFSDCLWWRMRLVDRWLQRFDPDQTLVHWQMLLEVLLAHSDPAQRGRVAENLQLPHDSIERLRHLDQIQSQIAASLPGCDCPSQVVQHLRQYEHPTLILVGVFVSRPVRRKIWRYLTEWNRVTPILDGSDLKALGYKPGPQFREMLDTLLAATLDGEICDRAAAAAFLTTHYPR